MPSEQDGVMIILSSPSGAGKTTLVKKLSEKDNFEISISHTTRLPSPNEINGKDYYFVSEKEFEDLIKQNNFSNTGFALIYNDDLYKKKIVSKKLENRDLLIFQKNLKKDN